jgi:hypothetical protein
MSREDQLLPSLGPVYSVIKHRTARLNQNQLTDKEIPQMAEDHFKLTYATMFNPPEELHTRFEDALAEVKAGLGKEHGMIIGGRERFVEDKFEDRSPADTDVVLGVFQKGSARDAQDALAAARRAVPVWSGMPAGTGRIVAQSRRPA